jgi:hypothetical protein
LRDSEAKIADAGVRTAAAWARQTEAIPPDNNIRFNAEVTQGGELGGALMVNAGRMKVNQAKQKQSKVPEEPVTEPAKGAPNTRTVESDKLESAGTKMKPVQTAKAQQSKSEEEKRVLNLGSGDIG